MAHTSKKQMKKTVKVFRSLLDTMADTMVAQMTAIKEIQKHQADHIAMTSKPADLPEIEYYQ